MIQKGKNFHISLYDFEKIIKLISVVAEDKICVFQISNYESLEDADSFGNQFTTFKENREAFLQMDKSNLNIISHCLDFIQCEVALVAVLKTDSTIQDYIDAQNKFSLNIQKSLIETNVCSLVITCVLENGVFYFDYDKEMYSKKQLLSLLKE